MRFDLPFLLIFQNVAWLTVESLAERIEGGESDGFGLPRFQDGKVGKGDAHAVGQFGKGHLTTGHHDIEIYAYHTVNWFSSLTSVATS